jgi:hypothetical protein
MGLVARCQLLSFKDYKIEAQTVIGGSAQVYLAKLTTKVITPKLMRQTQVKYHIMTVAVLNADRLSIDPSL